MVLYFSGTGNSRYVAQSAAEVLGDQLLSMNDRIKAEEARQIVTKAEPDIDRAAGQAFPPPRNNLYDSFMSGPVNPIFHSFFVKAKVFAAGDTCTGCSRCAKLCPTNNITIPNGRPV